MLTVVETPLFQKQWPLYWSEEERGEFAAYIPEEEVVLLTKAQGDSSCPRKLSPNPPMPPLQTDLTNPGRLTPAFSAAEDHVVGASAERSGPDNVVFSCREG